jgi:hypothetical protein
MRSYDDSLKLVDMTERRYLYLCTKWLFSDEFTKG